jgi:hypothetical protein
MVHMPFGFTLAGSMHSAVRRGVVAVAGRWQAPATKASPSSTLGRSLDVL